MSTAAPINATVQVGKKLARRVGLIYVNDFESGIQRRRQGTGFVFLSVRGKAITSSRTLKRIEGLVIPPAWENVWICAKPNGHVQVRGRDPEGRLQCIYHPSWHDVSSSTKYDRLARFAQLLPSIRRTVRKDLSKRKLTKRRVQAAIIRVLDKARIRIGNERYSKERDSRGATTLHRKHVDVEGVKVSLDFPGKSGQRQEVEFWDAKVAKVIRQCEEIRGQFLFSYQDEFGKPCSISSADVNAYLREIADESLSAKDFRTWWGSVAALQEFLETYDDSSATARRKSIVRAVASAANELGNTKAVCRKSYIHPGLIAAAETGKLASLIERISADSTRSSRELSPTERAFAKLLPRLT
jgi:DNA topoisomerase I